MVGIIACNVDAGNILCTQFRFDDEVENAEIARLKLCAKRLYANVRLAELNANISFDRWSAICRPWYACEQSILQKCFLPAICWAAC